ncbi:facilitated trehalose transporter Tret1-like [Agrilus planipennis]|uniref:Facilitated trehalose transporter Tret1-like n=1 Tax=Agrilus planipennis TaxID=224129 RepID=A0A7F5RG45_AGRPL|nr:facilitated trehalose transporter Tret1-like [Agrilus planipennis]
MALYIARLIGGIASGQLSATLPIYIGEISEKDIRGRLSNLFTVLGSLGGLYIYTVGPFVSYHVLAGTCAVVPFIVTVMCWFLPETPYYLAKKNKTDKARECIVKLSSNRTDDNFIEERMQEIRDSINNDSKNSSQFWELITEKQYRKPFLIVLGIKTIQHFSGSQAISAYMQTIMQSSGSNLSSSYSSIIFGFTRFIAAIVSGQFVDKIGRKPLLLLSASSCSVALFGEGAYFYVLEAVKGNTDSISWIPLTALVIFEVMITIGVSTLPYIIIGELFTMNVKGYAASFSSLYSAPLAFAVTSLYIPISENWGTYTMFWFYASTCFLGSIFILIFLPETKNKTFDEIQKKLNNKK